MHLFYQKTQRDCLVCFDSLKKDISLIHMIKDVPICLSCIRKLEINDHTISFHHYPLRILYSYNDFFQSLLYQYKGLYDIALKDVFLCLFKDEFQKKYKDYIIVVAPSSSLSNKTRGFAPMEVIASTIHNHIFTGLYKKEEYKQSDLSYNQRKKVKDKIGIRDKELLRNKKVLIMDDVITSSSTMATCLALVQTCQPSKIELLVLSSSHW
ncbi:MAG: phosphoribosyltransferase family protein [Bacilli bacterium]|nr:phosphoribosyltransferase family protein [Bacilli bacterium]